MLGNLSSPIESGILPRCVEQILQSTHGVAEIYVSFVQIYCEVLGDLLNPVNRSLSIRERAGNVFVEGLSKSEIKSFQDLKVLLDMGEKNRATAATLMNATSSRSHAALIITICYPQSESKEFNTTQINLNGNNNNNNSNAIGFKRESSLVLVDLAGSERYSASAGNYSR
jgi:kinesin family protein 5